jgi:hypothetical protein
MCRRRRRCGQQGRQTCSCASDSRSLACFAPIRFERALGNPHLFSPPRLALHGLWPLVLRPLISPRRLWGQRGSNFIKSRISCDSCQAYPHTSTPSSPCLPSTTLSPFPPFLTIYKTGSCSAYSVLAVLATPFPIPQRALYFAQYIST